jgi:uncharacterized membrane protein
MIPSESFKYSRKSKNRENKNSETTHRFGVIYTSPADATLFSALTGWLI